MGREYNRNHRRNTLAAANERSARQQATRRLREPVPNPPPAHRETARSFGERANGFRTLLEHAGHHVEWEYVNEYLRSAAGRCRSCGGHAAIRDGADGYLEFRGNAVTGPCEGVTVGITPEEATTVIPVRLLPI